MGASMEAVRSSAEQLALSSPRPPLLTEAEFDERVQNPYSMHFIPTGAYCFDIRRGASPVPYLSLTIKADNERNAREQVKEALGKLPGAMAELRVSLRHVLPSAEHEAHMLACSAYRGEGSSGIRVVDVDAEVESPREAMR